MTETKNIEQFLRETEYCNFHHPTIKRLAIHLAGNASTNKEKAMILFRWVRDNSLYRLGNLQKKASQTLQEKEGTCTNKANLLVALLRANNIPAGFGVMRVDGRKYFGNIASRELTKFVSDITVHIYAGVYLDGKWIKCDPSVDKELCENTSYFNPTTQLVNWSGTEHAIMNLNKNHILKETFPIDSIDSYLRKKAKNGRGIPLKTANILIQFARKNKKRVSSPEEFERLFKAYFKKNYPLNAFFLQIASSYKNLTSKFKKKKSFKPKDVAAIRR